MKITAQMLNEASFKKEIAKFEKMTGRGIGDGLKQIAESTGKALASGIRPYGLSAKKGKEFEENIKEDIRHVRYGVNVGAYAGSSIEEAMRQQRNRGRVRIRKVSGKGWEDKISMAESESHARKEAAKAGTVTAGWVEGTNQATGRLMKGIPAWIKRHLGKGLGTGQMVKVGANTYLDIHNKVRYADSAQSTGEVMSALARGRKNALKYMMLQIGKATKGIK